MPASAVTDLRFRQIHLDFHTSQHIPEVAGRFDPDEFADTLKRAAVDSVTCFARCHHGYIYYDSKAHPERVHPTLQNRNLLGEQIEACHQRDIRVPIYVTVQWDAFTARQHPEWLAQDEQGKVIGTPPFAPGFYNFLLVNSPYAEFLKNHVQEILETFDVDGFFFDIVQPRPDCSRWTVSQMLEAGLDPSDADQRQAFAVEAINAFKRDMTAFIQRYRSDCTIFYNAGHIGPRHRSIADAYTHFELESLPSGGWGYLHFPLAQRYARNLSLPTLGMTGKFHTSWGDFHSLKNEPALAFECFSMLALGARCSVGDQLHPSGKIDAATYDLVGSVYREVAKKEPWCRDAVAVSDIGVLTPEAFVSGASHTNLPEAAMGLVRMLQEGRRQFELLDADHTFDFYKLLILPDEIPVDEALAAKLAAYSEGGGKLLVSGRAGLDPTGRGFGVPSLGVSLLGESGFDRPFVLHREGFADHLPRTEHVVYGCGLNVAAAEGAEILADEIKPYFNRDWQHYCSHQHTPSSGELGHPAIVQHEDCVYMAHPVFTVYQQTAAPWVREWVLAAINRLLPNPVLRLNNAPSYVVTAVNSQADPGRYIVHLLGYVPERRNPRFDTIEDVVPLPQVEVDLRVPAQVTGVSLVPQGQELPFEAGDGRVRFTLPELAGHQMVSVAFA